MVWASQMIPEDALAFVWITDFPMFEWNEGEQRLEALHHPFTAPNPGELGDLKNANAQAYDCVLNGVEVRTTVCLTGWRCVRLCA
jgi:aspartyl-tRNA synthetase